MYSHICYNGRTLIDVSYDTISLNRMQNKTIQIWEGNVSDYKLLDSGNGQKLEQVGDIVISRSEPKAWWNKKLDKKEWNKTNASFEKEKGTKWKFEKDIKKEFDIKIGIGEIKAKIKFGVNSKHIGIFPEQIPEWKWMHEKIQDSRLKIKNKDGEIKVLNLFGYTGIASLVCADAGASVTHIDASKSAIEWAKENQRISGLEDRPIRWILDDCLKFLSKEIRQGKRYDAIIMDPPSFGHGPNREIWKIEEKLPELLKLCKQILSDDPLFIIFNMYSTELSSISLKNILDSVVSDMEGETKIGELAIREENSDRLLPMSIFALWER